MKARIAIAALWLAASIFTYGALNADLDWRCQNEWRAICDQQRVNDDRAGALVLAFIAPIALPTALAIFTTGGHGWSLTAGTRLHKG